MGEDVVHVIGVTGRSAANIGVPSAHGPTSRVVGVQRDGLGLILDHFQVRDELIRSGRQAVDAGILEDLLVIDDAGGIAHRSHTIDLLLVRLVDGVLDFLVHVTQGTVGDEVVLQFGSVDRRNHHDVAPVATLQAGHRAVGVIAVGLDGDLDVRIHLVEFSDVLIPSGSRIVFLKHIGTMAEQLQIGLDVLASLAKLDVLVLHIGDLGGAVAATASRHAHRTYGCDAGCDDFLEIHLLILPYESLFITLGDSAPILRW